MSTRDKDMRQEWRRYWRLVLPAILSLHLSLALGLLLFADLILRGGYGGVGGFLGWGGVNAWQARPGGGVNTNAAVVTRRHVPGIWTVQRPAQRKEPERDTPAGSAGRGLAYGVPVASRAIDEDQSRAAAADASPANARKARAVFLTLVPAVIDACVATTVVITRAWPGWTAVLAMVLLVWHLWLWWRMDQLR